MSGDSSYWLHSVSVVVTAEFHNPSILNPDFLALNQIVPSDWTHTEAVTTPPVSVIRYDNGIQWIVDQSNLTVTEVCESHFRDSYLVYRLVTAYLECLPHVPYRSLGINCVASLKQDDPGRWLTERFLKPGSWLEGEPTIVGLRPHFALDAGDVTCNLALDVGSIQKPEGDQEVVTAIANVHHAGPLDTSKLKVAIERWPERQDFVISALDKLLKRTQT